MEEKESVVPKPRQEDSAAENKAKQPFVASRESVSQAVEENSGFLVAPRYISWIERPFRVSDPESGETLSEVTGWAMDSAGRGPLNQVGSYVGNAVLILALIDAGCSDPKQPCDAKLYGLKPSSLLTASSSIIGVVAAILMPVIGAVVDHTTYRRSVGAASGFFAATLVGLQLTLTEDTWFFVLVLDALQSFALLVHVAATFAYLPDLTTNEASLSHFTAHFNIRQFSMQLIYVCLFLLINYVRGLEPGLVTTALQNARDAAGMAFGIGALCFGYSWMFLFRSRPALRKLSSGQHLLTAGFAQVNTTAKKIVREYSALKWFMASLLWSPEAGAGVVLSIAVTFLTVSMRFSGFDLAITLLVLQVANLVGSLFSKFMVAWCNPLNSYRLAMMTIAIGVAVGAIYLDNPEKRNAVFGFAAWWGIGMGWMYPSQRVLLCTLIPKGQETEMMGLFVFVGQIMGWLPPLLFTIINENGVDQRWGMGLIPVFCSMAVMCTLPMGNYQDAVDFATLGSEEQRQRIVDAARAHGARTVEP